MKSSIPQSRHSRSSAAARPLFFVFVLSFVALVFAGGVGANLPVFFQDGDIGVTKTGPDTAQPNTDIVYTITVSSSGPEDVTGASLNDNLPAYTTFVSLSSPAGWSCTTPPVSGTGTVNCTNSSVPAGTNDVFTLTAHIDSGVPLGTFITNQATVSGSPNQNTENDSSPTTTLIPAPSADLNVNKAANVGDSVADRNVTYTITVGNGGPDAAANAALNDPLPADMTFVSENHPGGWSCTSPGVGSNGTVNCTNPSLAVTNGQVFTIVGHIPPGTSTTQYNNTATVSSTTEDPTPENNSSLTSTTVSPCLSNPVVITNADSGTGSLRQAIIDACEGTTITFDMSQVVSPITLTSAELLIDKNLTITGPGANLLTVMRSSAGLTPQFRIFNLSSGKTAQISGLTIANGRAANGASGGDGGGILNAGTLTLTDSTINGNRAGNGTSGSGGSGGGIFNSATLTLTNSTISSNHTGNGSAGCGFGGGIYNAGTLTSTNSTISGNDTAGGDGGNGFGGGIYNQGTLTLTNSTVSGNAALGDGGGMGNAGNSTLTNVTVGGNRADAADQGAGTGGGILRTSGTLTLRNSIVAANFMGSGTNSGDISGTVDASSSFNLIGTGGSGGLTNGVNNNQVGVVDLRLGPLANNGGATLTHALLAGSPALDAGSNTLATNAGLTTDQRAGLFSRIVDGPDADTTDTVDIGAFEAQVSVEDITDKTTNEDTQLQFTFNVGGAASITSVTATSSNTALVPNNVANMAVSGSGSTRTLTINPVANQFGTSTITVTVNGNNSQSMTDTFVLTVAPVADTPSVTNATTNEETQSTSGLVISRNAVDGAEVTHFKITNIINGALFKNNGATPINNGDFITLAEGNAGLKFTPATDLFSPSSTFSFQVQGATSNDGSGLSSGLATATITVNGTPDTPSVTNATTIVNTQSTSGLVISRNAVDSTEVTNFKITSITGGTLFKNNGTTQINNNDFITFAEGNAGLKFTPALNSNANGSFQVQASLNNTNAGLGGGLATATITVNCGATVVTNSNDSGAGSLRAIINSACPGSTITFAPGVVGPITLSTGELAINKNLTINGPGVNTLTISGNNASRVFDILSGNTVTITDLTIANGKVTGGNNSGGGVLNSGTLTLTNCNLYGNSTSINGGGIFNSGPSLTLNNCNIGGTGAGQANTSGSTGSGIFHNGVSLINGGTLVMTGGSIVGNSNEGIVVSLGTATLNGVTITNNVTSPNVFNGGAGIFISSATANIVNCLVANNTAKSNSNGGISFGGSQGAPVNITVVNSTISGNTGGTGGGILGLTSAGNVTLTNTTITNNRATAVAGGGINLTGPPVTLNNTIVAGNFQGASPGTTAGDINGTIDPGSSFNLIGSGGSGGLTNGTNNNQVGVANALLGALASNGGPTLTHALLPGSPAIDAGNNAFITNPPFGGPPFTDQRGTGFNRIVNTNVDIGAFESRGFTIAATSGTPQNAQILSLFGSPLLATVSSAFGEPVAGGAVTFTAPAPGSAATATLANGTATFTASTNNSGQASSIATANGFAGGPYNVTVTGAGIAAPASFSLTNNKAATGTTLSSSANPSDFNQSVTFTATVTSVAAKTGTVQFKDNGTNLGAPVALNAGGLAQFTTSTLTAGNHAITADYSGDANFLPSTGTLAGGQNVLFRPLIKFSQSNYLTGESSKFVTVTVNRLNDTVPAVTVDYATPEDSSAPSVLPCSTANGVATPRCDFTTAVGTLRFASGETSKTFNVLISQDNFVEGPEVLTLTLSNLTGGVAFAQPSDANANITINDEDFGPSGANPIDDTETFVRQTYHDFLNREPDAQGLAFWKDNIDKCNDAARRPAGQTVAQCLEVQRINTSAAFFLSIEFQNTGYFVERTYKTGFGDISPPTVPVPIRFTNFLRDTQDIGAGVVVGVGNWQAQLDANKRAFALAFVQRPEFLSRYPALTSAAAFVDALNANAGSVLSDTERSALIAGLSPNSSDNALRANVLLKVAENGVLQQREFNRAFVLMQYFGYLRRNPDAAPEPTLNFAGFNFWLNKLNQFNGDFIGAEMIKAFIGSAEYRQRFGP